MKKDWKDIEGQLVRIDIGSTYNEAQSSSTDAAIICFTTDGHIVLNGVDYVVETDSFKGKVDNDDAYQSVKHAADWCTTYILQGDSSHPFLQGRLTEDTYNIGWMLDGYTYKESVKIPLISEEQQGLVDAQAYTDYIQPLLKGEYDDSIDALKDSVKKAQETADGKVDNDAIYQNVKGAGEWCQNYVMTDRSNVGKQFLKYRVDTTAKTLNIGWLTAIGYAETIKIPLVDDTQNCFFDPFYYETYIQPLFNDEYALLTDVNEASAKAEEAKAKADSHDASITALNEWKNKKNVADGWCALDTNGKVGEGFIPDSAYEVHMFGGVVTLEDGIINANSVTDKPTDEGCAIVYDTTTRSFCFRKKVADEGDPDLDYEYYNNWVGASRFGAEWKEQFFKGWRPAADNLYIDTTTSKAYYYNGSELVSLSGQGASGSIPNATTTQDGLMSKEDKTAFEQLKAKVAELENKLCLTYE